MFDGPRSAPPMASGEAYALAYADDAGPVGATVGSPCQAGDDCAALGPGAACFRSDGGGFCTVDCSSDLESGTTCPAGTNCFLDLFESLTSSFGRLCLATCAASSDCGPGFVCGGPLFTFDAPDGGFAQRVCLPACQTNADCNTDTSHLLCDPQTHRCDDPAVALTRACHTDADCGALGAGGACLHSAMAPDRGTCTVACDPSASAPCPEGVPDFTFTGRPSVCQPGYATAPDGGDVPVCLLACTADAQCQGAGTDTCNFVPSIQSALCTVACAVDADCPSGRCNVATGDCQQPGPFDPGCSSDSDCTGGLCVTDFHVPSEHDCSQRCTADAACPAGSVCVTSPDAHDAVGDQLPAGFCAPTCTPDAGSCADPTARCLAPVAHPEIDFSGSCSASADFCWR